MKSSPSKAEIKEAPSSLGSSLGQLNRSKQFFFDDFQLLKQKLPQLQEMDADVIVPLKACEAMVGPLQLRAPARDTSVFSWIIELGGIWEPHVTNFLARMLRPGDTFVDGGANFGYFTLLAASQVQPEGQVLGFEPLSINLQYCRENVALNGFENVSLYPYALWHSFESQDIIRPNDFLGGAYLNAHDPTKQGIDNRQKVQCVRLDDLVESGEVQLSNWSLLKLDIEGSEPFALDGMSRTIGRLRPIMVIEMNPHCLGFFNFDTASLWDRVAALDYRILVLPKEHQKQLLEDLWLPLRWPEMDLREFETYRQLTEAVEQLNKDGPDALDLVAIPRQFERQPFWS